VPYFPQETLALTGSNYTTRTLTSGTGVQPNLERPTNVNVVWSIQTAANNQDGLVVLAVSPDNVTYTTVAQSRRTQGAAQGSGTKQDQLSAIVPPGWFYRATATQVVGTPTLTFISCTELTL
jgi:hypothetical protein